MAEAMGDQCAQLLAGQAERAGGHVEEEARVGGGRSRDLELAVRDIVERGPELAGALGANVAELAEQRVGRGGQPVGLVGIERAQLVGLPAGGEHQHHPHHGQTSHGASWQPVESRRPA